MGKELKLKIFILSAINIILSFLLVSISLLTKQLIDKATSADQDGVLMFSLIIVGIMISLILLKILFQVLENRFSLKLELSLRKEIYLKIINKEVREVGSFHSGKLANIYQNDVKNIVEGTIYAIPSIFSQISRFAFAIVALVIIDYKFLIALVLFGIVVFIFARIYSKKMKRAQKRVLASDGNTYAFMQESIENLKIVKAMGIEDNAVNQLDYLFKANYGYKKTRNNIALIGNTGVYTIMNLGYVLALVYGAFMISGSMLTYGSLTALLQLVNHFEAPLAVLSSLLNRLTAMKASKERIDDLNKLQDDVPLSEVISDFDQIIFDRVSFSYDHQKKIIDNFSLLINKDDLVVIKGPSGIGKTTILGLLLGFLKPDQGKIYIVKDKKEYPISKASRGLFSYVPQENILFSGTIRENINFFAGKLSEEEITSALKLAEIYDDINSLPKKLDTPLNERGSGISIGQIQRILIAISLLKNKQVMLLDEFTSALDFKKEERIIENLKQEKKTMIIITHRQIDVKTQKAIFLS